MTLENIGLFIGMVSFSICAISITITAIYCLFKLEKKDKTKKESK